MFLSLQPLPVEHKVREEIQRHEHHASQNCALSELDPFAEEDRREVPVDEKHHWATVQRRRHSRQAIRVL